MTQLESIQQKFIPKPLVPRKLYGWYQVREMIQCIACGVVHAKDDYPTQCICGGEKFKVFKQRARR